MANVATITPLNQFFDTNGSPLTSGYLYFGLPDQDPEQFPTQMYWDAAATVPALQPIRTISGYPSRAGSPAILYGPASYSLRVRSSASVQILYAPSLGGVTTSAALAASDGAGLVGFIQAGAGSVARTALAKMRDLFNVKDFGAIGDGVADDTVPVQAAVTAALAAGATLRVPAGTYKLVNKITGTGAFSLIGDGYGVSKFSWPSSSTASTSGFEITVSGTAGLSSSAEVKGVSFITAAAALGTALKVIGSASLASDRITPRLLVRDVFMRGATNPTSDGWSIGLFADNCSKTIIDGYAFWGKVGSAGEPTYDSVAGIKYDNTVAASPHPTEFSITNSFITYTQTSILTNDFEGGLIRGNQLIATNVGVQCTGSASFPHVDVSHNHINASTACILVQQMFELFITDNLLYKELGVAAGAGIDIQSGAQFFSIKGNIFECLSAATNMNGVVVSSGSNGLIDGNIFRRCDATDGSPAGVGIWLTASASSCVVGHNNTFNATATQILNQGTGNKVAQTTLALSGGTSDAGGAIQKWGSVVLSLNASGDGTLTFPTAFPSSFYTAVICSGDPTVAPGTDFSVNQGASTAATISFSVRPNPGAIPVRINYTAFGS